MEIMKLVRVQWDRGIAIAAAIGGLLVLLIGYLGVSDTEYVAKQMPYFISAGVFGIFLLSISAVAWLSADLRDEWREIHALRELVEIDMAARGVK
ncbi:hypothetical protein GCM10009547_12870 [Sporichthya brevicatena]|uniref:Uncharacterized protein n=2 Tax=Sporichthya brevicatena TaxID=171442 RepID=A0ABN1GIN8_9ACTN